MAKIKEMTNAELLERLELMCFLITNYPHNKTHSKELARVEKEMAKRLGITDEELEDMHLRV